MLKMHQVKTILLLYAWFCGAFECTTYNASVHQLLIEKIYGLGPCNDTNTCMEDNSCKCPDELFASGAQNCVCVKDHYCSNERVVDRFGSRQIGPRVDADHPCQPSELCCSLDNITIISILPAVPQKSGCGWRKSKGVIYNHISNSNGARFGEFPWMVALLSVTKSSEPSYKCGGSLIHPQAVITAAHCVVNKTRKYLIRAGEWDLRNKQEPYPSQDRKVKSVVIHPNFSEKLLLNDIAFLLLESPINMVNPHMGLACLPQQGETFRDGTECFATGWGKDKFGLEGKFEVTLKRINLPIMEKNVCEKNLRKTKNLGKYFDLDRSFICAGGKLGKDTCEGDGGSPLVCPIPGITDQYQQAGIVSWGVGCGDVRVPGVYTNIALFRNWIDQQAINNNLDTSTYTY